VQSGTGYDKPAILGTALINYTIALEDGTAITDASAGEPVTVSHILIGRNVGMS
jgi:hypothetical protein